VSRHSRRARCASAIATTARACARSHAADTAAPLALLGSSCCCLADAVAPLTALLAAAGGPMLGTFGRRLREAITLVALLRACAHERVRQGRRCARQWQGDRPRYQPLMPRDGTTASMATTPCLGGNSRPACGTDSGRMRAAHPRQSLKASSFEMDAAPAERILQPGPAAAPARAGSRLAWPLAEAV